MTTTQFLLLVYIAFTAIGAVVRYFHVRRLEAERAAQRKRLTDEIQRITGMTLKGDLGGTFELQGSMDATPMSLKNKATVKLPGPSAQERDCALVEMPISIADVLVCQASDLDAVMGAMPAIARSPTGEVQFDKAYHLFRSPVVEEGTGGFRTSPDGDALAWTKPDVLHACIEQKLSWLRVRDGKAEIALAPVDYRVAHVVLTLATNILRASTRRSLLPMPAPLANEELKDSVLGPISLAIMATIFGLLIGQIAAHFVSTDDTSETTAWGLAASSVLYVVGVSYTLFRWLHRRSRSSGETRS